MKNLTMRSMFVAAALAAVAGSASAQTYKAEIPVSFHVGKRTMTPGAYQLHLATTGNGALLTVLNVKTSASAILLAAPGADAPKAWRQETGPVISFECLGPNCVLNRLWTGSDISAYNFSRLKVSAADAERIAAVNVTLVKGD
jgi:hypothetical protein